MRDVPRPAAVHGAWNQSACARRDRGRLLPSRSLADPHVPHCAVSWVVDASEGRLLSRWTIRRPPGCGQPLRRPFQAQSQHRPKERPDRVPERNLSVEDLVILQSPDKRYLGRQWAVAPGSLSRLIEISKIRRPLTLLCRHDHSVGAEKVRLSLDADMMVVFHAVILEPPRMRVGTAAIALGHNPRTRQGVIEDGDLIAYDVRIVLVESI